MTTSLEKKPLIIDLLNGTYSSIKNTVPIHHKMKKPKILNQPLNLQYGVLIGLTIDMNGKLILAGDTSIFASIGEAMFGMQLENEMLTSFSGELGNMIAGSLSTNLVENGIRTDITSPIVIEENTTISDYQKGLHLTAVFANKGELDIYILLD